MKFLCENSSGFCVFFEIFDFFCKEIPLDLVFNYVRKRTSIFLRAVLSCQGSQLSAAFTKLSRLQGEKSITKDTFVVLARAPRYPNFANKTRRHDLTMFLEIPNDPHILSNFKISATHRSCQTKTV